MAARERIAKRAPTHRAKQHGTGMVTHNYGSADGATYQTGAAEVRLQEAVGLRQRDWRTMCLGPMQGHLGVCRRGEGLPDLGQMRGGRRSALLTGASSSREGGGGRRRNLCYRHSRMSVRFEAWFATRDRAMESSEGWRERGQGGSRFWVPGLLKRFGTREWLQGLGSWVAQGSRKVLLPSLVSWLLDSCSPAGGALGGKVQRRPAGE